MANDQAPIPPSPDDKVAPRAEALRRALSNALKGLPEKLWERDAHALKGDLRRKAVLQREIGEILKRLDSEDVEEALSRPLGDAYGEGFKRPVEGDAAPEGAAPAPALDRDRLRNLARVLVDPLQKGLENASSPLPYIAPKLLTEGERRALIETAIEGSARGLTTTQMAKLILDRGIVKSFGQQDLFRGTTVVLNGKPYPADRYAESLVRTATYWASNQGALDRAEEIGAELVTVIVNPGTIDFCLDLEGKVYALTAEAAASWGVPLLSSAPNGGPPFHPNCRHSLSPFVPRRADAGSLPVAPDDVLTRAEGQGTAQRSAQAAFMQRLQDDPTQYAEIVAESVARRGFGGRGVALRGSLKDLIGEPIPGLPPGQKERFGATRALAEDVHLFKRMNDSGVKSRKEYRQRIADTLRAGSRDQENHAASSSGRLYYYDPSTRWAAIVDPAEGQLVTAYPLAPGEWERDFKNKRATP